MQFVRITDVHCCPFHQRVSPRQWDPSCEMLLRRQQGVQNRWTSSWQQHTSASLAFKGVMPDVAEFDTSRLGAWVPSREQKTATGLECTGLLRPAFEVQLDGPSGKTLTPDANPATGGNPLCLFLKKTTILKPGQLVVL